LWDAVTNDVISEGLAILFIAKNSGLHHVDDHDHTPSVWLRTFKSTFEIAKENQVVVVNQLEGVKSVVINSGHCDAMVKGKQCIVLNENLSRYEHTVVVSDGFKSRLYY